MNNKVILLCLSVFIFFSCKNPSQSSQTSLDTLSKIRNTKELNVGYFIFEPTIMLQGKDSLHGVFVEMIEKIALSIHPQVKVKYHPTTLATFHTDLAAHKFDLCIGATFATPKRASKVAFTNPLFYCGYTGVAKVSRANDFKSWSDLDNGITKVSVLQGSAIADYVASEFENQKSISKYPGADLTVPLAAVSSGQVDVGLMNQITVKTFLREHPNLIEILSTSPVATTYFSWSLRPNDFLFLNFLNTSIDYYKNSGEMSKIEEKYGIPLMHLKQEFNF